MGISIGAEAVHALLLRRDVVLWAGHATYEGAEDLKHVIARLACEGNGAARPRVVCVVLERKVVQLRTLVPAPPLRPTGVRGWVELEAPRLFRKNGAPIVTDARLVRLDRTTLALWAAAAPEPLLEAVFAGCAGAGLAVDTIGVSAEVLPYAVQRAGTVIAVGNERAAELVEIAPSGPWRSRLRPHGTGVDAPVTWISALAALGDQASHYAPALGAAVGRPRFALVPRGVRRERDRHSRRSLVRLGLVALIVWVLALAVYLGRLSAGLHSSTAFLQAVRGELDSALAARRDLQTAREALTAVRIAELRRSHHAALLAAVAISLPDSAFLVSWQVTPERVMRLAGYAPVAARVLAALERVGAVSELRFDGSISREVLQGIGERDRFAVAGRVGGNP